MIDINDNIKLIADLHIHSKHSRACGKELNLLNLEKYARIKGVDLLGTGDFTHPIWIKELKENLKEDEQNEGIYRTKTKFPFILQTEISLVYTQDGKGRRIHHVVWAPDFDAVKKITEWLLSRGRIDYDGRPIFKISSIEFVEKLKEIDERIEVIPAHIWTPWFGMLGSNGGFNSVKECFDDMTKHIQSVETGLSSDPPMNWRLSQLDKYSLVSFSDLHSFWPWRMGREATEFELKKLNYKNLISALNVDNFIDNRSNKIISTIEVDPNYGKYHFTGHRNCNISMHPNDAANIQDICPKCNKKMTVGVLQRVDELADRNEGFKLNAHGFHTLVPLSELISNVSSKGVNTKFVWERYNQIMKLGNENQILLNVAKEELMKVADEKIVNAIILNRKGLIKVKAGYDGEYGVPMIGEVKEVSKVHNVVSEQKSLGEF
ncbi:endonuclease Q family protein [Nanoarchaeota archaeon]